MHNLNVHRVGVVMNGVTGRMGANQHLRRSLLAIRDDGGIPTGDGRVIVPEPVLVGRDAGKLERLARETGVERWTTDLDEALGDDDATIYFDAQTTNRRYDAVALAIEAGKHVYCEKPPATTTDEAMRLYRLAEARSVKHGVVQDKLWLPGFFKLNSLLEQHALGRLLAVRGEFGYWVFEGDAVEPQRPSWNYRGEDGGGIILDMLCHWRYLLDGLIANVEAVSCLGAVHLDQRWDEDGHPYVVTAEDAAYATFRLEHGIVAQFNASWATRVRRHDLLTVQVDGTEASAVAGLRDCYVQPRLATPRAVWNPDVPNTTDYYHQWLPVADQQPYDNAFRQQWTRFLLHVVAGEPFPWNLLEGAKGVQLAEMAYASWKSGRWMDLPPLV